MSELVCVSGWIYVCLGLPSVTVCVDLCVYVCICVHHVRVGAWVVVFPTEAISHKHKLTCVQLGLDLTPGAGSLNHGKMSVVVV